MTTVFPLRVTVVFSGIMIGTHIRRGQPRGIGGRECGVGQPQWRGQQVLEQCLQRFTGRGFSHGARDVHAQRVQPLAARREQQRRLRDAMHVVGQRQRIRIHAIADAGLCVRAIRIGFEEAVTQPAAMAEQLAQADRRRAAIAAGAGAGHRPGGG